MTRLSEYSYLLSDLGFAYQEQVYREYSYMLVKVQGILCSLLLCNISAVFCV
ncbi:hypothetical protein Q9K76_004814 [Escherichia coli]|nr:hypothetical protein [Escherichia coli]ELH6552577.1 hypothetical protein [Escherichia coli]ELH6567302.1 hypothetical protein [Escherichia coli]ELH6581095.1 hypothetical protein [Escherichia coli]ELH6599538.1 hypothetical protein [Escherichia coli]